MGLDFQHRMSLKKGEKRMRLGGPPRRLISTLMSRTSLSVGRLDLLLGRTLSACSQERAPRPR